MIEAQLTRSSETSQSLSDTYLDAPSPRLTHSNSGTVLHQPPPPYHNRSDSDASQSSSSRAHAGYRDPQQQRPDMMQARGRELSDSQSSQGSARNASDMHSSQGSLRNILENTRNDNVSPRNQSRSLSMSIASANIHFCRAVRDLVYSTSIKRNQDRMSLCVESVTRSSSQLRDLLLSHEFSPKSSAPGRGKDGQKHASDSGFSTPQENREEFLKDFEYNKHLDDNQHEYSQSPTGPKERSLSPRDKEKLSTRLSVEKETTKEHLALGNLKHASGNGSLKTPPDETISSTPLFRPSSIAMDVMFSDVISFDIGQDRLSSPNRLSSSSYLSSPLSTSSLSLASTTSFNIDPSIFVDENSPEAETGPLLAGPELLDKNKADTKERWTSQGDGSA